SSFPDYNVYAGTLDGVSYLGAIAFTLPDMEAGGLTTGAHLLLFGLTADYLRVAEGQWVIEALQADNGFWQSPSYQQLNTAPAAFPVAVIFGAELAPAQPISLPLDTAPPGFLDALRYQKKPLTLRIRGPETDGSLFGFDGGVGSGSLGNAPRLFVSVAPAQPTAPPIVVTATPTPETVLTADAISRRATVEAELVGTATPPPYNQVTATPTSENPVDYVVIDGEQVPILVPTATPENVATADMQKLIATAEARTTGTPTPLPTRYVTATPTSTPILVTATPTPENAITQEAMLLTATARATVEGPATPLPPGVIVVTPIPAFIVVTETLVPENAATAAIQAAEATVRAILYGTPSAPLVTATPTPTATEVPLIVTPDAATPTPTPTPTTPAALPADLRNKILFLSDRSGREEVYALDPATGDVVLITQRWPYDLAQAQMGFAPDGVRSAIVAPNDQRNLEIYIYDEQYDTSRPVTTFNATSYDPAWSPDGAWIAFVSTEANNDEIYLVSPDGAIIQRLTYNSWEWDKHPTWSPDGRQIAFWSNRETGRSQIWIMDADGSNPRNLSNSDFNDRAPIWVR
ncbi:MAG: PD40 domain-containing protein, partial [Caldilineaceae bacterium]|nr:PD40 domain-containing protein [Caldilineaceae bacterium]